MLLFLILIAGPALAQDGKETKKSDRLRNFEHLDIDRKKKSVQYEQRLYRNPFTGLMELKTALQDSTIQTFTPLIQGAPIGTYRIGDTTIRYTPPGKRWHLFEKYPAPYKRYKLDFWVQPVFAARFGYRLKPVESNFSMLLNTQIILWKGMALTGGILFPLTNDMDNRPKIIRPAPIFLNQFIAKGNHFLSASAGFFYTDRYGVNLQYRHADLTKNWSFGVETGLTGVFYYPRGGIYYEPMDELMLLGDVAYRVARHDVTLKLTAGQFLHNDKGARFEFIRQFPNVEVGLYATKTQNGSTAGFNFAIPIPPGKIAQGKNFRFRTTEEFRWEYTYSRGYQIGERYRLGYQLDQRLRQYHQQFLQHQLDLWNKQ